MSDKENLAGSGTYEQLGYIYSKLAGFVKVIKEKEVSILFKHCEYRIEFLIY